MHVLAVKCLELLLYYLTGQGIPTKIHTLSLTHTHTHTHTQNDARHLLVSKACPLSFLTCSQLSVMYSCLTSWLVAGKRDQTVFFNLRFERCFTASNVLPTMVDAQNHPVTQATATCHCALRGKSNTSPHMLLLYRAIHHQKLLLLLINVVFFIT